MTTVLKRCEFTSLDVLFFNVMITLIKRCDEKGYFFNIILTLMKRYDETAGIVTSSLNVIQTLSQRLHWALRP